MHLAIDAVGIKHSGGAVVLLDFLRAALDRADVARVTLFCSPRNVRRFGVPASHKVAELEQPAAESSRWRRIAWHEAGLARAVRAAKADIVLCFTGCGVTRGSAPHVTFIHQSVPFSVEGRASHGVTIKGKARIAAVGVMMKRSATSSREVFVQTPTMRHWVSRDFGVPIERIRVFTPAPRELPTPAVPTPALDQMHAAGSDRRLLYVGSTSPHKNLDMVARAIGRLRQRVPGVTLFVTCSAEHAVCRHEGVVGVGYLEPAELREAYELATVLVMPSLVETTALPMSEAMSVGTPVLAADRPYARDMCDGAALLFDPLDEADLAEKAANLLSDEGLRAALVSAGLQVVSTEQRLSAYSDMVSRLAELCG